MCAKGIIVVVPLRPPTIFLPWASLAASGCPKYKLVNFYPLIPTLGIRHLTAKSCAKWQNFGSGLSKLGMHTISTWHYISISSVYMQHLNTCAYYRAEIQYYVCVYTYYGNICTPEFHAIRINLCTVIQGSRSGSCNMPKAVFYRRMPELPL